jgi:hypothetical protein
MSRLAKIPPFWRGMALIAVISLAIVELDQETALSTAFLLTGVAFYIAIAVVAYLLWRDFGRREISIWPVRQQRVFYSAVVLFLVDFGWYFASRFHLSGRSLLVFFVVAAACIYVAVRTWRDQQRYS